MKTKEDSQSIALSKKQTTPAPSIFGFSVPKVNIPFTSGWTPGSNLKAAAQTVNDVRPGIVVPKKTANTTPTAQGWTPGSNLKKAFDTVNNARPGIVIPKKEWTPGSGIANVFTAFDNLRPGIVFPKTYGGASSDNSNPDDSNDNNTNGGYGGEDGGYPAPYPYYDGNGDNQNWLGGGANYYPDGGFTVSGNNPLDTMAAGYSLFAGQTGSGMADMLGGFGDIGSGFGSMFSQIGGGMGSGFSAVGEGYGQGASTIAKGISDNILPALIIGAVVVGAVVLIPK